MSCGLVRRNKKDIGREQGVGIISLANLRKTAYYLKRNGVLETWYAARERIVTRSRDGYQAPDETTLAGQRKQAAEWLAQGASDGTEPPAFSIVVPAYRTPAQYLRALVLSVCAQSYPAWELLLADATEDDSVAKQVEALRGELPAYAAQIRIIRLERNGGISANTNAALAQTRMPYVGLLDHDDLLTPDALYEMAALILRKREKGIEPLLLYSDEDKCDGGALHFYEQHRKEHFNYDLLLSNNYICHFLVMERALICRLGLRPAYDGAQDYDLVLRAVRDMGIPASPKEERLIGHIPKVLYHWRCHTASTAENPRSKEYAYEAGLRALQDHLDACGIRGTAYPLKHVGFYGVRYPDGALADRTDLGAVGGPVIARGRIVGGRMKASGKRFYENIPVHFSGYMHRAVLMQDAEVVDIRNIRVQRELWNTFEETVGVPYRCLAEELTFDAATLPEGSDITALSIRFCNAIRKRGYRILWRRERE